ncbi:MULTISPECIES: hypothetical protein [unclassified Rhodococcus (in: high G+C Gram-positive bacteria)]|uniref:hypothetical protein n=1 Tax=unclassified Rhodococcus (in: high G+C Gram-positive bacteria) TaxID=192944 RepID=UPI001144F756|nr:MULTISPECIES: hypothetical protein [unclassified Rhodococcus (in: high G+C Gram-positive bacteria)]TQC36078.1 hypothetical protein EEB16_21265 [Rhodococcus sp. WS7]
MHLVPNPDDDDFYYEDDTFDPDAPTLTSRQSYVVSKVATELADALFADAHLLGDLPVQPGSGRGVLAELPACTWTQAGCDVATHHGSRVRRSFRRCDRDSRSRTSLYR